MHAHRHHDGSVGAAVGLQLVTLKLAALATTKNGDTDHLCGPMHAGDGRMR